MKNKLKYLIIFLVSLLNYSEIIVDNNTNVYVEKANNGVEVINISTPSSKGVSDSTFTKFNVDNIGAILNNSINISKTNIAGYINANKNLTTPARLALLRVTSENKSEIKGILEAVSSKDLDVIISNKENGFSREMIIYGMGAYQEERVKQVLIELLDDEEVNGHVPFPLSKFKDIELIKNIEPFLKDKDSWKRKEAMKAIKKLEKLKK